MADRNRDDRRRIDGLARWFAAQARDLPWRKRRRRTGWGALVAEAMLQQTQVARVVERYEPFLRRFPTPAAMAEADVQEVLALWQGLGYYRRARNLHAAARTIVERHGGRVPRDAAALRELPGVGRYTAGAIASIVHGAAEPIVDGNVQRVLDRWDADASRDSKRAWARAATLAESAPDPGAFNEALMELGALVCTPAAPRCGHCPVSRWCAARREGRQESIPPPKPRARRRSVHHHAVVVVRNGRVLLERRPADGLWAELWQPPAFESTSPVDVERVVRELAERGVRLDRVERQASFEFATTHRAVTFHVHTATTRARRGRWVPLDELDDVPMSNAHRRVIEAAARSASSPAAPRPRRPPLGGPRRSRCLGGESDVAVRPESG